MLSEETVKEKVKKASRPDDLDDNIYWSSFLYWPLLKITQDRRWRGRANPLITGLCNVVRAALATLQQIAAAGKSTT